MHAVNVTARSLFAALTIAGCTFAGAAQAQAQAVVCGDRVVVAFGDSLSAIARRCGTTVSAILAANPLLPSPDFVFPGMTIAMPRVVVVPAPVPEMPQGAVVRYTVRPGDTLSAIARSHGVALADIYRLNPNIDAATLRVGDVVRLPAGVVVSPAPRQPQQRDVIRYIVKPGDTLSAIARAHGLTLGQIYELNPNIDFQRLRVGDLVRLPADAAPARPAATVSVEPDSGAPGTVVQVSARGFPRSTRLRLLAGRNAENLREFRPVTTDNRGRADVSVRIPDWAAGLRRLVFAFETPNGGVRAVSEPFRIREETPRADDRVTVTGTLTREGAECQAMRGDDGTLYTLAGEFRGFRPGDRVRIEGRIAEVSTCMQGTTIDVRRIEAAG